LAGLSEDVFLINQPNSLKVINYETKTFRQSITVPIESWIHTFARARIPISSRVKVKVTDVLPLLPVIKLPVGISFPPWDSIHTL
jgi:hypothetical protein